MWDDPHTEDNSEAGLTPTWRFQIVTPGRGPYPENASSLSLGCTPISGHSYAGPDVEAPICG